VNLTDSSRRLADAKYQALKAYGEFINAALSEEEAAQFEKILTKLVSHIQSASVD
jgi:DNA-binding MarR family transcriptional regulator